MQSLEHSRFFLIRFKARFSGGFQPIKAAERRSLEALGHGSSHDCLVNGDALT
jgi:hypothetical protein